MRELIAKIREQKNKIILLNLFRFNNFRVLI